MTPLLFDFRFAEPVWLWLLLALPLLWLRSRSRSATVVIWRSVILALVTVTLADPQFITRQTKTHEQERFFAFDLSRSIPASMRAWMATEATANFSPSSRDRVFVFGAEAKEAVNWQEWLQTTGSERATIQPGNTSLEKLFESLLAAARDRRDLFLFSDGWETQGDVQRLLPAIASSGLRVFPIVPADRPHIPNVVLAKLLAPTHVESGETINIRVVLENHNDRSVEGTLALSRNGQTVKNEPVKLNPGSQIFTHQTTLAQGELTALRASFTPRHPGLDSIPSDNQALTWITVRTKAKVLLLNGRPGGGRYLEEILKRQGFEVMSRTGDSPPSPAGYNIVIFNNIEREKLSSSYLASIERYVAAGNSFIMLGSEWSFGPGGYRRTPIETILPVELKEPQKEEQNRAVVLVIDKSGSMREDNRILFAQEAAKAVARQLKDNDLIAVVGFDVSPFTVIPMETVARLRGRFDTQVDRIKPGGQTYFFPALMEAKRQLEKQNVARKHIILLSDGETRGSQGELIDLVNAMKSEMKITVSAVAIGSEADIRVMKRISQYGGGLFHHTIDPTSLPQIVLQQLQQKPKDEPPAERDWLPVQERGSEILAGLSIGRYPPVRGLIDTEVKRSAHLDLSILREERKTPLLASWKYGQGKTVALTMDLEGRWSRNWVQWSGLPDFWARIFEWLQPAAEAVPSHEARISILANQPILDLYVYEDSSADSQFHFALNGKASKSESSLKKLAPGRYQAALPLSSPGDYRIDLYEDRRGRRIDYPPLGYTLPYDLRSEMPRPDFNLRLLAQLADMSGGEINPDFLGSENRIEQTQTLTPLRQPLIIFTFVLFLLEIAVRRLLFAET